MVLRSFKRAALALVMLSASAAWAGQAPKETKEDKDQAVEVLYGWFWNDGHWVARVKSFGCTYPQSFIVKNDAETVTLVRKKPDLCRASPHLEDVPIKSGAPTNSDFILANPLRQPPPHWD